VRLKTLQWVNYWHNKHGLDEVAASIVQRKF